MLEEAGIEFTVREFDHPDGDGDYGRAAADALGVEPERVFKTLVVSTGDRHAVAITPVDGALSLKAVGAALGVKKVEMCDSMVAQRLTGYVVGGISPFGQRKRLPTVLDETATAHVRILVSGGKRGLDVELSPGDLVDLLDAVVAPIRGS